MQDITVAAIQMNAPLGEIANNVAAIAAWARKAAAAGAELVCFPELGITGHWCAGDVWSAAEPVPDGPSCQQLGAIAAELDITLSVGLAEIEAGIAYNTQVILGPSGYLGKQRKVHMSADEYFHFRMGSEMPVIDIGKCRLAVGICYDNLFPEVARIAAIKGAEVYLMPHAARMGEWVADPAAQTEIVTTTKRVWSRCYATRAYDNGMYVVVCNQAGAAGERPLANHAGGILIYDPDGELLAESQTTLIEDEMVIARLDAERFGRRRRSRCFPLQTRRPEVYGELAQER